MKPLAIDLFCGLGGWTEALLAEGYDVIGFDIEQHEYGEHRYPGLLVIQNVTTLHGSQFKDATLIVASPPCQAYSYRAMPWKRAKALPPPDNTLFETCFRLQREACEAAGRHIPLIVENVRGAQKWVGRARWAYGSFYLWGDVPALMPVIAPKAVLKLGVTHRSDGVTNFHGTKVGGIDFNGYGTPGYKAQAFNTTAERRLREDIKNAGGSWFAIAHNTTSGKGRNPDGRKVPGFRFDGSGKTFQSASVNGLKAAQDGLGGYGGNFGWNNTPMRRGNSKSAGRKMVSAMIAKIPEPLARHIAATFHP